jgi:endonuclease/exonuclease/phosphatase family metal-dependent hydrolase
VYDYIPVVGPYFRNAFAWVYLFVGLVLLLGVLATGKRAPSAPAPAPAAAWAVIALALVILAAQMLVSAHPAPASPTDTLTILTYNIQQGYSAAGRKNYDGQLAQIRAISPDIIGLQESDTARVANSNDDVVRYFADHLDMHSYYGPKTVDGTFGIALLSRYPIQNAATFYMYSEGEQVAAIRVEMLVAGKPLNVFITHLGNGGPMIQQQQLLQVIDDTPRAVALGDFNFRPDSAQYALTTRTMLDTWPQKWPAWKDDQGHKPDTKIDHIFITPDLRVLDARYYPDGPSDHPALTAAIAP